MQKTMCLCGNEAQLHYKDEIGRIKESIVTIKNVPIFQCPDCEDGYMTGPNSLRFAEQVRKAVELGVNELEFQKDEGFDQIAFNKYLIKLQKHLFDDMSLNQIIKKINDNHRAKRFFAMYLLKDQETFQYYYQMRAQLSISSIFDTIINALFNEREKKQEKQELINLLQINADMADQSVEGYPLKEFDKDLNSFLVYWRKNTGRQFLHKSFE